MARKGVPLRNGGGGGNRGHRGRGGCTTTRKTGRGRKPIRRRSN